MSKRSGYEDIETLRDADGVVAVISRRVSNNTLAVGFFKEFIRDGEVERTAFLQRRHLPAVERLRPLVEEAMDRIGDKSRAAAAGASPAR